MVLYVHNIVKVPESHTTDSPGLFAVCLFIYDPLVVMPVIVIHIIQEECNLG